MEAKNGKAYLLAGAKFAGKIITQDEFIVWFSSQEVV
ncbi:hypothetical protein MNBD_BACTEROID03-248 [hydrothermal vent metagenome]|uniref:Uncharacterized protein n=1 Tax=hydrothermal vent metagenome TaxID=652676 RepID=A0A3B0T2V2_9ZZZZ